MKLNFGRNVLVHKMAQFDLFLTSAFISSGDFLSPITTYLLKNERPPGCGNGGN